MDLVFPVFAKITRDIHLLKTCRLVCKSWNKESCEALRNLSYVSLNNRDLSDKEEFHELLWANCFLKLPSPFKQFRVVATEAGTSFFLRFICPPHVNTTKFRIKISQKGDLHLNLTQLKKFLIESRNSAMELKFGTSKWLVAQSNIRQEEEQNSWVITRERSREVLDALEVVSGSEGKKESTSSLPNKKVATELNMIVDQNVIFPNLLKIDLKSLDNLTLFSCPKYNHPELQFLVSSSVPQLNAAATPNKPQANKTLKTCLVSATSLRRSVVSAYPSWVLPPLPNVWYVQIYQWQNEMHPLSPKIYPALTLVRIYLNVKTLSSGARPFNIVDPHKGVKTIILSAPTGLFRRRTLLLDSHLLLKRLGHQFPSVEELCILGTTLHHSTWTVIVDSFLNLKTLRVRNYTCESSSLPGKSQRVLSDFADGVWSSLPPPLRLAGLATLSLRFPGLTNEIIKHFLLELPAVETLEFDWNEELSMSGIKDCLGQVKMIVCFGLGELGFEDAVKELENSFPKVRVDRRRQDELIVDFMIGERKSQMFTNFVEQVF